MMTRQESALRASASLLLALVLSMAMPAARSVAEDGDDELRTAAQNPIADLISVPLQNNVYFGIGEDDDVANVLNIQPVIPFTIGDWNLITRTIVPVIHLPEITVDIPELPGPVGVGDETGLGDINLSLFLSPNKPLQTIWGFGPSINIPTATDDILGSEKWSAGPSAVSLVIDGPWVFGVLVRNLWSFAGDDDRDDVSQFLAQPFLNYNMSDGWYLTSSPIVTANWEADDSDNRWTVPIGGGFGRLMRFGTLPVNLSMQGFYQVERPDGGSDWIWRTQVQFLFPRAGAAAP